MAEQIDKFGNKLFAYPNTVTTTDGPITLYPQRTNNILEQFFRGQRYAHRRKTGIDSMERALRSMLSDTPLIKNMNNPKHMKILLDGKADLEELFTELGPAHLNPAEGSQADGDRILPGFRALMKLPTLPDQRYFALSKNVRSRTKPTEYCDHSRHLSVWSEVDLHWTTVSPVSDLR